MSVKVERTEDRIERALQHILDDRLNQIKIIKLYGYDIGVKISNILAAGELGMIPRSQVANLVRENIELFIRNQNTN